MSTIPRTTTLFNEMNMDPLASTPDATNDDDPFLRSTLMRVLADGKLTADEKLDKINAIVYRLPGGEPEDYETVRESLPWLAGRRTRREPEGEYERLAEASGLRRKASSDDSQSEVYPANTASFLAALRS